MNESLNNNYIAYCIKCRKGFERVQGIYGHYSVVHIYNNDKNIIEKRNLSKSEVSKKRWENSEYKNKMVKLLKERWKNSEYRNKVSKKIKNALLNPEWKNKQSIHTKKLWENSNHRERVISAVKKSIKAKWQEKEYRDKMVGAVRKNWKNLEFRNKMVKNLMKANVVSPNKCEQSLQQILNELFPNEWKFVGDGSVILGGFRPDFINCNGKKLIIEFNGDYWHSSEKIQRKDKEKAEKYKELGFDVLVIKEKEFKNDQKGVKNRINDFVKNYEKEHSFLLT